jgi:methionyl aminopeptidase
MIHLKSRSEIESMKKGGAILRQVVKELVPQVKAGMTTNMVDKLATDLIFAHGGEISFNKVPGFKWATCLPVNEQVVHTPPSERILKTGDILTIDIGVYFEGFHTDYATSIIIDKPLDPSHVKFLEVGQDALRAGMAAAKEGNFIGDISEALESVIYGNGYFVLRDLTGHGVGKELHEPRTGYDTRYRDNLFNGLRGNRA